MAHALITAIVYHCTNEEEENERIITQTIILSIHEWQRERDGPSDHLTNKFIHWSHSSHQRQSGNLMPLHNEKWLTFKCIVSFGRPVACYSKARETRETKVIRGGVDAEYINRRPPLHTWVLLWEFRLICLTCRCVSLSRYLSPDIKMFQFKVRMRLNKLNKFILQFIFLEPQAKRKYSWFAWK